MVRDLAKKVEEDTPWYFDSLPFNWMALKSNTHCIFDHTSEDTNKAEFSKNLHIHYICSYIKRKQMKIKVLNIVFHKATEHGLPSTFGKGKCVSSFCIECAL